jgi:hypothetical protein
LLLPLLLPLLRRAHTANRLSLSGVSIMAALLLALPLLSTPAGIAAAAE